MKRFFTILAVLTVISGGLTMTQSADAKGPTNRAVHAPAAHAVTHVAPAVRHEAPAIRHEVHQAAVRHEIERFRHRDYHGWTRTYWNPRFSCNWFLCPEDNLWYYWYAPLSEYLPTSCIDEYPPTAAAPAYQTTPGLIDLRAGINTPVGSIGLNVPLPIRS